MCKAFIRHIISGNIIGKGVQRTPSDAKCITEILGGGGIKIRKLVAKIYFFVPWENRCIKPTKQSKNLSNNYE